jgi:hypothetical protein
VDYLVAKFLAGGVIEAVAGAMRGDEIIRVGLEGP